MPKNTYRWPVLIISVILVAALSYGIINVQDKRDTDRRIRDAVHDLPQDFGKTEQQMDDRTSAQKMDDDIRDTDYKAKASHTP